MRSARFLCGVVVLTASVVVCGTANAGLVGEWLLDEGSGGTAYDSSPSGYDGTLQGGASYTTDTPFSYSGNYGMSFDGSGDYVDMGNPPGLNFGTGSFTVQTWLKSTANNDSFLSKKASGGAAGPGFYFFIEGGKARFDAVGGGTAAISIGNSAINDGAWHHIAAVVDRGAANQLRLYVDGAPEGATPSLASVGSVSNSLPFHLARYSGLPGSYDLNGQLDEVRVEDRAVPAGEIHYFANNSLKPGPEQRAGQWLFTEGSGNTTKDSTPNGNDGTISGATFVEDAPLKYGGYSMSFDGSDDSVKAGPDPALQFGDGSFSVQAWVKSDTAGNDDAIVSTRGLGSSRGFVLYVQGGKADLYLRGSSGNGHFIGNETIIDGQWHQVVAVRDAENNTGYLYVDGELDKYGSIVDAGSITNLDGQPLTIGAHGNSAGYNFPGLIDEVMVIGRTLTPDEVRFMYNNTLAIPEPSTLLLLLVGLALLAARGKVKR